MDINDLAKDLSNKINEALDICAPKKVFTIKPKFVQDLTDTAKTLMKDGDLARSKLKLQTLSFTERKALTFKYRITRNKANTC